ncbi:MAG: hypothetical protein Kow0010_17960 [Dehalococcoidia bacterium]
MPSTAQGPSIAGCSEERPITMGVPWWLAWALVAVMLVGLVAIPRPREAEAYSHTAFTNYIRDYRNHWGYRNVYVEWTNWYYGLTTVTTLGSYIAIGSPSYEWNEWGMRVQETLSDRRFSAWYEPSWICTSANSPCSRYQYNWGGRAYFHCTVATCNYDNDCQFDYTIDYNVARYTGWIANEATTPSLVIKQYPWGRVYP